MKSSPSLGLTRKKRNAKQGAGPFVQFKASRFIAEKISRQGEQSAIGVQSEGDGDDKEVA